MTSVRWRFIGLWKLEMLAILIQMEKVNNHDVVILRVECSHWGKRIWKLKGDIFQGSFTRESLYLCVFVDPIQHPHFDA